MAILTTSIWKILLIASFTLLCAYYMELYDLRGLTESREVYSRIFKLIGVVALFLAVFVVIYPKPFGDRNVLITALLLLIPAWIVWRIAYERLMLHPSFRQRVYLIGEGELARRVRNTIDSRPELGMDIVGWAGYPSAEARMDESLDEVLRELAVNREVEQVIVALSDRRMRMPVNELLELRLRGVIVEEGTTLLEKISGQIEVDELRPSWLIFGNGFRLRPKHWLARRVVSSVSALILTVVTIVLVPLIALLIKLTSRWTNPLQTAEGWTARQGLPVLQIPHHAK